MGTSIDTLRNTRRLTRAEAAKLGVDYSRRLRVRAGLKRVTKRSKLFTEYSYRRAKLGIHPRAYALIRRIRARDFIIQPSTNWFDALNDQPMKILKKMASAPTSDEWFEHLTKWDEENPDDYNNPFFYHTTT